MLKLEKLYIRTSLKCKLTLGVCQMCYGWNLANGRMVELGETIGILAAQSIGEPGTQLTMRTFHTGGIFSGEVAQTIQSPAEGIIKYNEKALGKKIVTKYNEKAFLTLEKKEVIIYKNNKIKLKTIIPEYSLIYAIPKTKVFYKQIIAECTNLKNKKETKKTKEIKEIKSPISGTIFFEKKEKANREKFLWISSNNIIINEQIFKTLKENKKEKFIKVKKIKTHPEKQEIKISLKNLINLNTKRYHILSKNKSNNILQRKFKEEKQFTTQKSKTTQLIRSSNNKLLIGQFFQKRKLLSKKIINKYSMQIVEKRAKIQNTQKATAFNLSKNINIKESGTIKKNNTICYLRYSRQKTEDIVQGLPKIEELLEAKRNRGLKTIKNNPHEKLQKTFSKLKKKYTEKLAARKSIEKLQKHLIKSVQNVYETQGVKIANKHLEIIIKQMTSKGIIVNQKSKQRLAGEIMEINKIEMLNETKNSKIQYEPILIGISKLALINTSFIASASFQETTKVLTKSAIEGKTDWLYGLKENIILGNIIPAGTGYNI